MPHIELIYNVKLEHKMALKLNTFRPSSSDRISDMDFSFHFRSLSGNLLAHFPECHLSSLIHNQLNHILKLNKTQNKNLLKWQRR